MKIAWGAGRGLVTLAVLLGLAGLATLNKSDLQEDNPQVASLVHLARSDLQDRLDAQDEVIVVESTRVFTFPCPDLGTCQGRPSGYIIRLAVNNLVYEYNARMVGQLGILWHEVSDGPAM
jgi:hypothetical protein